MTTLVDPDPAPDRPTGSKPRPDAGPPPFVPATPIPRGGAGGGTWAATGVRYDWSLRDVSGMHHVMNTRGAGVFLVARATVPDRSAFQRLLWIQYTEAVFEGRVYVPPPSPGNPTPSPWRGIDRYPNDARGDDLPYTALPDEQSLIDRGFGYGGRVRHLYSPGGADAVDIDWASSGGMVYWEHFSVLTLVGQDWHGHDWRLGSLTWRYAVDGHARLTYGARPSDDAEVALWQQRLAEGYPRYAAETYQGNWPGNMRGNSELSESTNL